MKDTIIEIWNGNIAPWEHCGAHDPTANELIGLMAQNREKLCQGLTEAQMGLYQKYIDCSEEYLLRMQELAFSEGFCLGSKLAMESLL